MGASGKVGRLGLTVAQNTIAGLADPKIFGVSTPNKASTIIKPIKNKENKACNLSRLEEK